MSEELIVESMNAVEMTVADQPNIQLAEDSTTRIINAVSPTATAERVENGVKITITDKNGTTTATAQDGNAGEASYVYIKYAAVQPTQDSDMEDSADEWMGIYSGSATTAPTTYTSYTWYKIKGTTGDPGQPGQTGPTGPGVPSGGTAGLFLKKSSSTDYDTEWDSVPDPQTMTGATAIADGTGGLVPAPSAGDEGKFLKGDATWANVPDPQVMTGASSSAAGTSGLTPAPAAGDNTKFLRGDATWSAVPDPQTMTGATASAAGTGGLVPAPAAGANVYFLKGDGTWAVPAGGKLIVKDLDTVTNTSGSYTHSTTISDVTSDMKVVMIELGNPDAFLDTINVTTADGSITLSCNSVAGTSTVKVSLLFIAGSDAITSSEFDVLAARIGTLSSLTTTDKTSAVAAINELDSDITALNSKFSYPTIGDTSASSHSRIDELGDRTFSTWINTNYLSYAGKWAIGIQKVLNPESGANHSEFQILIIGQDKLNVVSRTYGNNAWGSWTDISSNIQQYTMSDGLLMKIHDTDVQTITKSGRYYLMNCSNTPSGISNYGYLDVYNYDNNYKKLVFSPSNANDIYVTNRINGTWSAWKKITS